MAAVRQPDEKLIRPMVVLLGKSRLSPGFIKAEC
jgi:hypothetical protein